MLETFQVICPMFMKFSLLTVRHIYKQPCEASGPSRKWVNEMTNKTFALCSKLCSKPYAEVSHHQSYERQHFWHRWGEMSPDSYDNYTVKWKISFWLIFVPILEAKCLHCKKVRRVSTLMCVPFIRWHTHQVLVFLGLSFSPVSSLGSRYRSVFV